MIHLAILLMGQGFAPNLDAITGIFTWLAVAIALGACLKVLFK